MTTASSSSSTVKPPSLNDLSYNAVAFDGVQNLPNNCTLEVPRTSTESLFKIKAVDVSSDGRESTNPYFAKMDKLVTFNWEMIENVNLIAVHFKKPLIAYTLNKSTRSAAKTFNSPGQSSSNQMIRIMNYETKNRCLAKGIYHHQVADLSFVINSTTETDSKLAIADVGGCLYIFDVKEEETGDINAVKVFEVTGAKSVFIHVRVSWCPFFPSDDDDDDMEGDPGLKLALSCDRRVELFAVDAIQQYIKIKQIDDIEDETTLDREKLKKIDGCYQVIEQAHKLPVVSLSISNDLTSVCTAGLDNRIKFYQIYFNGTNNDTKMFFDWEPNNLENDDPITAFHFLDDFDFLTQNSDQTIWSHALIGTKNGHVSVLDLKEWKCRQSIKLITDGSTSSGFSYKMDFTAHTLVAIKDNIAFLIQIHFPYDKMEFEDDDDLLMHQLNESEPIHPFISKVTRFQIYNAPLLSFSVKKNDTKVDIFWITGHSLEMCTIFLDQILVDDLSTINNMYSSQRNISLNEVDDSLIEINEEPKNRRAFDLQNCSVSSSQPVHRARCNLNQMFSLEKGSVVEGLADLNISKVNPSHFANQPNFLENLNRPQSPASKEVQQILSPSASGTSQTIGDNFDLNNPSEHSSFTGLNEEPSPFPTKLPNVWQDLGERQLMMFREEIKKEIGESELRLMKSLEKMENDFNGKLEDSFNTVHYNASANTARLELEMKEMKKELKTACKIRNDEFNKVIERLVNRLMLEMNIVISKGLNELMRQLEKETKSIMMSHQKYRM